MQKYEKSGGRQKIISFFMSRGDIFKTTRQQKHPIKDIPYYIYRHLSEGKSNPCFLHKFHENVQNKAHFQLFLLQI